MVIAEQMRDSFPGLKVQMNCGSGSFKSQFKKADKSSADIALVLAEDEVANQQVAIKYLREDKPQEIVSWAALHDKVAEIFNPKLDL